MNKLFSKIAALSVGLTMAIGVGVALGSKKAEVVKAADSTAEKTTSELVTEHGWTVSAGTVIGTLATSFALDSNITISTSGNPNCGSIWGTSPNNDWRLYQNQSGDVTVTAATGYELKSITFTYNSKNTGTLKDGSTTVASGSTQTVSGSSKTYTVGNTGTATNGQVQIKKFKVVYEATSTGKDMGIRNNSYASGPFEVTYGDTSEYHYALAYDVDTDQSLKSGVSWVVSDESIIDSLVDGYTWLAYKPKAIGTTTITASCEGYKDVSTTITVVPGTLQSLAISGSMTKTSYYVGESWSPAGFTATATYDSGYVADVTSDVTWSYSPSAPAVGVTSVVATASIGAQSASSSAQTVSVSKTNALQVLYTLADNTNVDVYGVYVGFLDGTGPVIMDGAYGMVCYNKTADVSAFTAGETVLHVTGKMGSYNGLRQIANPVLAVASGSYDEPETPVVYATKGGETAEYASRLTTVTGTAVCTKNDFSGDPGAVDITMNFTVGSNTIQVFYKKAAQEADTTAYAAMKEAVANETEITIKGFTGWYNGFQVQMNGYIPPAEDYTAEDFAQDLLDQTDAVCTGWEEGVDNHDALEAIWSNLASNDKYPSLPSDQKTILAEAARDESGTVVERAMARYDFLTGKYNLSNFINGRTPVEVMRFGYNELTNDNTMVIVVVIAAVSALAFTTLLVFKKKKQK